MSATLSTEIHIFWCIVAQTK